MILELEDRLAGIEALILTAVRLSPAETPAVLAQAVPALESACSEARTLEDRERLISFRAKLNLFSSAMRRGEMILQGYARHAGVSLREYSPAGAFDAAREPTFFSLSA